MEEIQNIIYNYIEDIEAYTASAKKATDKKEYGRAAKYMHEVNLLSENLKKVIDNYLYLKDVANDLIKK